jgi:hypothetical protein
MALTGDREKIKSQGRCWISISLDQIAFGLPLRRITYGGRSPIPKFPGSALAKGHGERMRRSIGGWHNTDINGVPLRTSSLSTKLTKVASYRRTVCAVDSETYLLRRINGIIEPLVLQSNKARDALLDITTQAIRSLHWRDFETLIDVIFARSGWHRASAIGGTLKLIDLAIEQPTTRERAAVQVKSSATQKGFDEFVAQADDVGIFDRLFFICHSPRGQLLPAPDRSDVHLWVGRELAATALRLGLSDWIVERIS